MKHVMNTNTLGCSCGRTRENHLNIGLTADRIKERWADGKVDLDKDFAEIDKAISLPHKEERGVGE